MGKVFVTGGSGFVGKNLIPLLIQKGYSVNALARSKKAIEQVEKLGATAVNGDMNDVVAIAGGMENCDTIFHLAASTDTFATADELYDLNVLATSLLLKAAKKADIKNFVYLGAASVVINGKPLKNADENFVSDNLLDGYSRTKLEAENLVLAENSKKFKTISVRPPLIWGKGDPHVLPAIIDAVAKGQLKFINGGVQKFVTCHVTNVCEALILAELSEPGGKPYFITDGEVLIFKDFIKRYLGTQGVSVPDHSVPIGLARFFAAIMEFVWRTFRLKGHPPLYKAMINTLGVEFVTNDLNARRDIGYRTFVSVDEGLSLMNVQL